MIQNYRSNIKILSLPSLKHLKQQESRTKPFSVSMRAMFVYKYLEALLNFLSIKPWTWQQVNEDKKGKIQNRQNFVRRLKTYFQLKKIGFALQWIKVFLPFICPFPFKLQCPWVHCGLTFDDMKAPPKYISLRDRRITVSLVFTCVSFNSKSTRLQFSRYFITWSFRWNWNVYID